MPLCVAKQDELHILRTTTLRLTHSALAYTVIKMVFHLRQHLADHVIMGTSGALPSHFDFSSTSTRHPEIHH